jgi:hypothetical protein
MMLAEELNVNPRSIMTQAQKKSRAQESPA